MIGQTVSHYKILEKLGGGGMGVVYKAHDTRLKRTVALKFLPPDLTRDEDAKTRFVHEAQAASALQHPNICTIHDVEQTDDHRLFIVMDCYEGESVKSRIENGQLRIEDAVDIATQVAQGLAKAHESGIVHRDIKPANIMIGKDGIVRIVDFGLAKLSGRTLLTKSGTTLGTAAYMSPEQAKGEQVDQRSDIWSLGVVLYEMITGKRPFESEYEQALVYSIVSQDPKPIRDVRPDVPEAIERICRRTMAKDAKDRYQSAAELIADIESYRAGSQLSDRTRKVLSKKHKLAYAGLAALLVLIAIAGIFDSTGRGEVFDRVAVLPCRNISRDSTGEIWADGMTEMVIAELEKVGSLNVPSSRSSMKFKRSQLSFSEIADELGARVLVDASVQYANNRVRVIVRLVDPPTDRTLWSETFDDNVEDILDLQSRIAQAVVREVRADVTAEERKRISKPARKVNPQAYELFLAARKDNDDLITTPSKRLWDSVMAKLQRAIELEPDNALYYASLSIGYAFAIDASLVPFSQAFPMAKTSAEKALQIDPDLLESQLVACFVEFWGYDFVNSLARATRAVELSPNSYEALSKKGATLLMHGRYDEALATYRRANDIDPVAAKVSGFRVGYTYFFMRRYDDAIAFLQQWLRQNPRSEYGHAYLACSYSMKGLHAQALAHCDSGPYIGAMNRPIFLLRAGNRDLALRSYQQSLPMQNDYGKATWFALLGQKDSAFYWLDRFYKEPTGELLWLPHDPFLDNLRDDPRFKELLKKMNLPD